MGIVRHNKPARHNKQSRSKGSKSPISQEPVELVVSDLNHDAQGVSRTLDKVTFVEGALPGEHVLAEVDRPGRHFNQAKLIEITSSSHERVDPACPHYKRCGACQLMHLQSDKQLAYKQDNLHQQFVRKLKLDDLPWMPAITSDAFGYRRRARLGIRYRNQLDEIIIGFREMANSHLTAIQQCNVLIPALGALIKPLYELMDQMQGKAHFTQVELIAADNANVVVLRHLKNLGPEDSALIKSWAEQQNVQLWLQGGKKEAETMTCVFPENPAALNYKLGDIELDFKVKDFIQANGDVNQKMVATALEWLNIQEDETVLDLFAGMGNFSLPIAKVAKQVTAVEGVKDMVQRMGQNAEKNNLDNVHPIKLNLADEELFIKLPKADVILLDPPRAGAADLMPLLSKQNSRILYVACEPSSLLRDAEPLLKAGFVIEKITSMDMFPQSKHIETMALFVKAKKKKRQ